MFKTITANMISQDNSITEFFDELDTRDLERAATVVFHPGTTTFKGYIPEMEAGESKDDDNLGWLSGMQLLPNWYFTPVSLNMDITTEYGKKLFHQMDRMLPNTVIVQSGEEEGGVCFYYLTESPVQSTFFQFINPGGSLELLGVNANNQHNWVLLPGSKLKQEYKIIEPEVNEGLFVQDITRLSKAELIHSLDRFIDRFGTIEYFPGQ